MPRASETRVSRTVVATEPDICILQAVDPRIAQRFLHALGNQWLPAGMSLGPLLYRGSVDGKTATAFHARCADKGPTLTLVRLDVGGHVCVFGGFTEETWDARRYKLVRAETSTTFVFSVIGPHCAVTKFSMKSSLREGRLKREVFRSTPSLGPRFGDEDLCVDLGDLGVSLRRFGNTFEDTVGLGSASLTGFGHPWEFVDVEVFAVV